MITTKRTKKTLRYILKEVFFNYRGKSFNMRCRYNKNTGVTLVHYHYKSSLSGIEYLICCKHYSTRVLDVNFHIKRLIVDMKEGVIQL